MSGNQRAPRRRKAAERAAATGQRLANLLALLALAGLVAEVLVWLVYIDRFGRFTLYKQETWGQFGDFIGGVSNPLLSFLALVGLLMTVKLQADQLDAAREELAETQASQERAEQRQIEQLTLTRELAQAQTRTAEAQERAALVLGKQLDEAMAAQIESAARQVEQLQAARELAEAQARAAAAMERAAAAQEASAAAVEAQFALASATAVSQHAAATAQFAAALFGVAVGAKEGGYPGPGSDLVDLHDMKPDAVQLIRQGLGPLLGRKATAGLEEAGSQPPVS